MDNDASPCYADDWRTGVLTVVKMLAVETLSTGLGLQILHHTQMLRLGQTKKLPVRRLLQGQSWADKHMCKVNQGESA